MSRLILEKHQTKKSQTQLGLDPVLAALEMRKSRRIDRSIEKSDSELLMAGNNCLDGCGAVFDSLHSDRGVDQKTQLTIHS